MPLLNVVLTLVVVGVLLWLIYGMLIDSLPIIIANAVTLLLASTNLALKLKYG